MNLRKGCYQKMTSNNRTLFIFLFLLGAYVRTINLWQPLDGNMREAWREADVASIARNYFREGMDIRYPRIDWRGDGPGFAEMEFPAYPWLIALGYKIFGYHEIIGKLLSYLFSLASLLIFFKLSRHLLPTLAAAAGSLFFALNPLLFRTANTLQPESLMLMLYLLAAYTFIRWMETDSYSHFLLSMIATALAILAKASAAHLGLFFLFMILRFKGLALLKRWPVWVFGIFSLLPAFLWYSHAHRLWFLYGNSLGISNESHWVGWDFFTNPYFIRGILSSEIHFVWMPMGMIIIVAGLLLKKIEKAEQICLLWLISIFIFYIIAARTTADGWAYYYHIVAVPSVALLFGNGVAALNNLLKQKNFTFLVTVSGLVAGGIIVLELTGIFHFTRSIKLVLWLALSAILIMPFFLQPRSLRPEKRVDLLKKKFSTAAKLLIWGLIFLIPATYLYMGIRIAGDIRPYDYQRQQALFEFARDIDPLMPQDALIISSGGICRDQDGYPVAFNASYMFFWLDRKGFNICQEEQSMAAVRQLIERGAKYFIAEKAALKFKPEFERELKQEFVLLRECSEAYLFDLQRPN